jgi:RNA polymerase sigma-70 factor (ECF subfamily)
LALNIVGDPGTAEEITLDVFTLIWEEASSYQIEKAKISTWMTAITHNRSIDVLRRRGSRPERLNVDLFQIPSNQIPLDDELEEFTQAALLRERFREAVAQLPDDQREALQLAYFRGYTHRQIADVLDQPLGTVKTRIRLAIGKMCKLLLVEESGR